MIWLRRIASFGFDIPLVLRYKKNKRGAHGVSGELLKGNTPAPMLTGRARAPRQGYGIARAGALEAAMNLKQLEAYLDECEAPLAPLPAAERGEWRDEARQHLLALAAAHIELGMSEEAAVEAALRQFGEPLPLGKKLAAAMRRTGCSPAEAHRRGRVAWNLSWNLAFAVLVAGRLFMTPPEAGGGAWGLVAAVWSVAGGLGIWGAGHVLAKVMLRPDAGDRRVWSFLGMSYAGFTLAALWLTGVLPLMTPGRWVATGCSVVSTLGVGWLVARLAERRFKQACGSA